MVITQWNGMMGLNWSRASALPVILYVKTLGAVHPLAIEYRQMMLPVWQISVMEKAISVPGSCLGTCRGKLSVQFVPEGIYNDQEIENGTENRICNGK